MTSDPDLNDVQMFAIAAQEGSLSAAAKRLHVPVSTVSRSLSRLEKRLAVSLVLRSSRGLQVTDPGQEYLRFCRRALQNLKTGRELLEQHHRQPRGVLTVGCPITMARLTLAPLLPEFLGLYPELRVRIEPYTSAWDQEPREDVDVFFKLRSPRDTLRRVRVYPATARGLFASRNYLRTRGAPVHPEDLHQHTCVGTGTWKLTSGRRTVDLPLSFRVLTSDPEVSWKLGLAGTGVVLLPLYMADWPQEEGRLERVLPRWKFAPLELCALFAREARPMPKVKVFLDFLSERIGTGRDPRLLGGARLARYFVSDGAPAE